MSISLNRGLPLVGFLWLTALLAALVAGFAREIPPMTLLPLAAVASVPAILGFFLWPFARKEWAQMSVVFAWIALAIIACFAISFVPMAILFFCAPAVAAIFDREKVIEAMILSAIFATLVYFLGANGYAPDPIATVDQARWGGLAGFISTMAFMVGSVFFAANARGETLNPSQKNMIDLAQALPSAALQFDDGGEMQMANDPALSLFGLTKNAVSKTGLLDLFPDDDETSSRLKKAFDKAKKDRSKSSTTISAPLGFHNGPDEPTTLSLDFVPRDGGSIYAFVTDNSEKSARLEELQLIQQQAQKEAAEKTLFFAGVSHELRTPLNAIIGFSDMMRSRLFGPLPGKYAEYADLIHDSGQHMLDLIGDVLDISKVEAGKYELNYNMFDASDVVRSTVKMIRPTADAAEVRLDINIEDDEQLLIDADRKAVRQILLNLLSNAIKFSPKGGAVHIGAKAAGDTLNLTVQDHGSGMTDDELAVLGTPYMQMSSAQKIEERGTGLGFTLIKSLTELHGGHFTVESQKNEGTTIDVFLPFNRDE